jgi:Mrp family chromosome partitioning ATPase
MERFVKAVELARKKAEAGHVSNAPAASVQPQPEPVEVDLHGPVEPRLAAETVQPQAAAARARPEPARTKRVVVSADAMRAHHITSGQERTSVAESFKRIRTQVLQRLRDNGHNSLGIASPRPGEGKTTVALNLAVHTAVEPDWTVLLVEADIQHAGVCEALGLTGLPGLTDYLVRNQPLEQLLVDPGLGRCVILPAGSPIPGSSEALGSARMQDLVTELKQRYPDRLVIFDLPPLLDAADGIAVLPWVEALLLVAEESRTLTEDLTRAAQLAGNERIIGTVLNKSRVAVPAPGQQTGFLRRLFTGAQ